MDKWKMDILHIFSTVVKDIYIDSVQGKLCLINLSLLKDPSGIKSDLFWSISAAGMFYALSLYKQLNSRERSFTVWGLELSIKRGAKPDIQAAQAGSGQNPVRGRNLCRRQVITSAKFFIALNKRCRNPFTAPAAESRLSYTHGRAHWSNPVRHISVRILVAAAAAALVCGWGKSLRLNLRASSGWLYFFGEKAVQKGWKSTSRSHALIGKREF